MLLNVLGHHVDVTDGIATHAQTRFEAALGQHDRWIQHVTVRLEDLNGPKGGMDKRCHASIRLKAGGADIEVEERQSDIYAAINVAADRAKVAVGRKIDRIRER